MSPMRRASSRPRPRPRRRRWPSCSAAARARAERPLVIARRLRWTDERVPGHRALRRARSHLPVATSFRRADRCSTPIIRLMPAISASAPNPKLAARIKSADLRAPGRRPHVGDAVISPTRCSTFRRPKQKLVHVHPGRRRARPRLPARRSPSRPRPLAFAAALADAEPPAHAAWRPKPRRRTPIISPGPTSRASCPGAFQYGRGHGLAARAPAADAIVCNGAGNFASWIHRFYRFRRFATQLAPTSGSMGYGVPAACRRKRRSSRTASSSPLPATAIS